jgi:hypothetical protein
MKAMVDGYRNAPGEHCGSVAMRSLLRHYCHIDLPENVVFGLGAGLDCVYLEMPEAKPRTIVFGRTATFEVDLARHLGVDYVEQIEPDDDRAWQQVREEVLAGRPTMLSGDIFYLDYRDYKVHFPGHRFVLLGFDDERQVVHIADRIREEPEVCSYRALFESRNPPEGISTRNLWGRFAGSSVKHSLDEACRTAIRTCARRMLGVGSLPLGGVEVRSAGAGAVDTGLAGIRRLARELPRWGEREDAAALASYNAAVIEKFGNGGGNFRRLYAGFLEWARRRDAAHVPADAPRLAWQSAERWTALAHTLWTASESADGWAEASRQASEIADGEQVLFECLLGAA